MTSIYDEYELVVGLEVHAQLLTKTKAFSPDVAIYGESPNTQIHPVSLGHPGTLPVYNKEAVNYALKMGIATNCQIREYNQFHRKNYFYADLPKGYQISQYDTPLCEFGKIEIESAGETKTIGITRIHVEEDSGKSIHDLDPFNSLVDLNRAGTPLIEIVSEPDMRSGDDAYGYLTEIRKLVRYLDICDGNMEEGSMRCDANISVRKKGAPEFGQKVEVKNMNSIRNVKRAIEFEFIRQIDAIERGEKILQQTMGFNAEKGETFVMRTKETATDYRYFVEPDLPPLHVSKEWVQDVASNMPILPKALQEKFEKVYGLNEYDASVLIDDKSAAEYFDKAAQECKNYKALANWMMGPIKSYMNDNAISIDEVGISVQQLAEIIQLIDDGKVNYTAASQTLFPELLKQSNSKPLALAQSLGIIQENNTDELEVWVKEVLAAFPEKVQEYKDGKKGILGMFMGQIMKKAKGKLDPKIASKFIEEYLERD